MNLRQAIYRQAPWALLLLWSCGGAAGVSPTGITGDTAMCPSGPRPMIDCRGVLQQYSRDLKMDLTMMTYAQVGLGLSTTKLTEADALTSDLLQHSYQTCTLYNACVVTPQQFAAKTEKLQELQMQLRRSLVALVPGAQQNIQINPPPGQPFPGGFGAAPGGSDSAVAQAGATGQPGSSAAPTDQQSRAPSSGGIPPITAPSVPPIPPIGSAAVASNTRSTGDAVLSILREGSQALRNTSDLPVQRPIQPTTPPPGQDLDSTLRAMVQSLNQDIAKRSPPLANSRAVVGNFTEQGQPWSGPMGALLQERLATIVGNDGMFKPATGTQTRGITIKEVQAVGNTSDPKALTTLYNADLAIAGTYQSRSDGVEIKLTALQKSGEVGQVSRIIPANLIPEVVAATPQNAKETGQLISSLNQYAPRADGKINLTTNRPGPGSSFRMGEEISYFASTSSDGYIYLFHVDGEKNVARIFPNQFQSDPRIRAGQVLQLPQPGASFKFEASPPFGLETTLAIVTATPLNDADLQSIQSAFASAKPVAPVLLQKRGAADGRGADNAVLWNSVTVLVRP